LSREIKKFRIILYLGESLFKERESRREEERERMRVGETEREKERESLLKTT